MPFGNRSNVASRWKGWLAVVITGALASGAIASAVAHATTTPGVPRYFNYTTPAGTGDDAGEPSIGSNWTTEQSFSNSNGAIPNGGTTTYFGGFLPYMVKATFNDCQSPALVTWDRKTLLTASTPRVYGDPILYTDHSTGRTFVSQLEGLTPAGSTTDLTDNDGDTFTPSQGGSQPSCVDHQTFGGGPFHSPLPQGTLYPNAIYYASQCVADAVCAVSLDGGVTFGASVPMYTVNDCAGLHGHVKVGPDGTVYIPQKSCGGSLPYHVGGKVTLVVSEDNGATWTMHTVPDGDSPVEWDPSVAISADGTVYLAYQAANGHARVAVSHDKGATWAPSVDVGIPSASVHVDDTPSGIHNIVFPAIVAGDANRAAFAFYGTTTADGPGEDHSGGANNDPSTFSGVWYLYIATTFDGGLTWTTQNVTPGDPIQRGPICGGGGCRNMLDFFDATIDKEGRVLVGWDDGCINGCVSGGPNSNTAKAVITRQSGGKRMFAAFDPVEPRIADAPGLDAHADNGTVTLSWQAPDNGGSDISAYKLYRKVNAGSFALLATVTATQYTDIVNPNDAVAYRVTAVNGLGEGPYCHDVVPSSTPVPTACLKPGLRAVNDLNPDGTDNDSGQNTPPDGSVNVRSLQVSEPWAGPGVSQLVFTLQVMPATAGTPPPSSQWYIVWNRVAPAADGSDRRFVCMKTDATGVPSFVYGDFGPPLPIGGVPPANANTPTPIGNADAGSYDVTTGKITITLATSKLDDSPLGPGSTLNALNVRTYLARPDAGQKSQNNASDITDDGSYTLVGNASCFCFADVAPTASLSASPTSGPAPLTVNFDASHSSDPDGAAGDAVGTYTFDFGDGTPAVTQSSPLASHTYTSPSGSSGYFTTLSVNDLKCGTKSLNVASANISVTSTSGIIEGKRPMAFRIAPLQNPARGTMTFQLDVVRAGMVSVQLYSADGRRVAEVIRAWMPAGTHSVHWNPQDDGSARVAAGVYMVRAQSGGRTTLSRVVLLQ